MHIDFRHLRTIRAIHQAGGLARAAEILHITQSALSHQIKGLEDQAGVELFVRRSKPLKLSAAGQRLLRVAERVLPEIEALEDEFSGVRDGSAGRLHIAIECHACFDWLIPGNSSGSDETTRSTSCFCSAGSASKARPGRMSTSTSPQV